MTITLAFTGASGMPFGLRLLERLLAAQTRVVLLYSPAAQIVARQECDLILPAQPREATRQLVDVVVARVLDHLGVANTLEPRWGAPADDPPGVQSV